MKLNLSNIKVNNSFDQKSEDNFYPTFSVSNRNEDKIAKKLIS